MLVEGQWQRRRGCRSRVSGDGSGGDGSGEGSANGYKI